MIIETVFQFNAALAEGRFAHGGYPRYFIAADGESLSFGAAIENAGLIRDAIIAGDNSGWRVVGLDVNYEDRDLYCAHTGLQIEPAYPND